MVTFKKIKLIGILVLLVGAGTSYYFYAHGLNPGRAATNPVPTSIVSAKKATPPTPHQTMSKPSGAVGVEMEYAADFSNDKILMGASHNVFVGKIIKQIGSIDRGVGPETQFEVQIVLNIKGDLQGMVTVDQEGGYQNGIFYYIQDGAPLLRAGATYLLATRYNAQGNWHTLIPSISGSQFIIDDNGLSIDKLQTLAKNDIRVKRLENAYPSEILLDADIKHNNELNSYQSLHGEAPSSVPADTAVQQ
jgi:hypothetical protein